MTIIVDSREHPTAIKKILDQFDRSGVEWEIRKLDIGDYVNPERPNIVVDRKHNLNELATNLFSPNDRGRFWREIKRAIDGHIKLYILCECGGQIHSIEDVKLWKNKYGRVTGTELREKIYSVHIAYGVEFLFCDKRNTGKRIIEILSEEEQ